VYAFEQKTAPPNTAPIDSAGRVNLPKEIYGLEFQDLRLPVTLTASGASVSSFGAFALPRLDKQRNQSLVLAQPTWAHRIWLFSDMTDAAKVSATMPVATLKIENQAGETQTIPLRAGIETNPWDQPCLPSACTQAYTWRKRIALLGSERYAESWREFDALIFASKIELDSPILIRSLEFQRVESPGVLYIWGLELEP
jgi:hypothetical protein